jgi:hypothetical protein
MNPGASGRPLRFFALVMTGWVMLRFLSPGIGPPLPLNLPDAVMQATTSPILRRSVIGTSALASLPPVSSIPVGVIQPPKRSQKAQRLHKISEGNKETIPISLMRFVNPVADFTDHHDAADADDMSGLPTPSATPPPLQNPRQAMNRWRGGAWILWRPGSLADSKDVPAGQLGASQVGVRLDYELAPHITSRITAYGRLTSALQQPTAPESAVGLSIQPVRGIPIAVAAERRIALGIGARNAFAIMAVGGFGPQPIAPTIEAEGYAQTGIVGFRRQDGFIDGKLSLSTPLPRTPMSLGVALSGGAQPGVSRLDVGPQLQIRLPLPQGGARLSVEWRERIAGDAQPGSGLAITLAADF